MEIQRVGTTVRYSDSVSHGGVVYGVEVPGDEADITSQAKTVLAGIERLLQAAGSHHSRLLMATVYLVDMQDYTAFNEVWDAWLPPGTAPVRACVQVAALARPGWKLEIAVTAACF